MNKTIQNIAERKFGNNEFIFNFKKAKLTGMAGHFTKRDVKEHFMRLKLSAQ